MLDAGLHASRPSISPLNGWLAFYAIERVVGFLRHLEGERRNQIRARNQRLAALHGFFEYLALRVPE